MIRVLVVHEWLYAWAGAERCLEQILQLFPDADLLVGVVTPEMRETNAIARRARESWVGRLPGARTKHRWFLPLHALAFSTFDTSRYDLIISSSHAFEKFARRRAGARHVCYCYSPPRFLWGMQGAYAARAGRLERAALALGTGIWRRLDRRAARHVDRFVSISRYIAARVASSYGVESDVVYPPVTAKPAGTLPAVAADLGARYLLTIGRLVEYKRLDLVVAAAERLKLPLLIAGDGPERRKLAAMAGPSTRFLGEVDEPTAGALLSNCAAFVFGGEEDFGIAMLEANAHGRPVVCFGRGAATETLQDGRTATFFHEQSVEAVASAITACLARDWDADTLRANAARFSPERFREEFGAAVARAVRA